MRGMWWWCWGFLEDFATVMGLLLSRICIPERMWPITVKLASPDNSVRCCYLRERWRSLPNVTSYWQLLGPASLIHYGTHRIERSPRTITLWRMLNLSSLCASLVRIGWPSRATRSTTPRETWN